MPCKTRKGIRVRIAVDNSSLTPEEIEMDFRANEAVKAAIKKAQVCKQPIAKYDMQLKKSYIEYPDGTRKYGQ